MKLIKLLACFITGHKWTSKAMKNIKPTETELKSYTGFKHYAKMYCDRCGKESKLNNRLLNATALNTLASQLRLISA